VKLTNYIHLVPWLRICESIPPDYMVWYLVKYRGNFAFTLLGLKYEELQAHFLELS